MAIRLTLAFLNGWLMCCLAAMNGYDGILTIIGMVTILPIFTAIAVGVVTLVGSFLLIRGVWKRWHQLWWLSIVILVAGVFAFVASWLPYFAYEVWDPDLNCAVQSLNPVLSVGGWLAVMFGLAFCPLIGFKDDRRWV